MPGFDDFDIEEEPRRAHRLVLDETRIVGDPNGSREDRSRGISGGGGGRVEDLGEIPAGDRPGLAEAERLPKAPPTGPTSEQRSRWDRVDRSRAVDRADSDLSVGGMTLSPVLDALASTTTTGSEGPARERTAERLHRVWDEYTSGDARLGGRDPIDSEGRPVSIVGRDERGAAPLLGAGDAMTLGFGDELAGAAGAVMGRDYESTRDASRAQQRAAREQAPDTTAIGEVAGSAPWMALPGAGAMRGAGFGARAAIATGQGAQLGAMSGLGHSDAPLVSEEAALDTATGGALGGALGLGGEAASSAASPATSDLLEHLATARDEALLNATTSAGRGQTAIQAFDRGTSPRAIAQSRASAARTLRETGAVPALGSVDDVAHSVDRQLEHTVERMDRIRSAMDGGGPTGEEVAERLREQASQASRTTDEPVRDVLHDLADRIEDRYRAQPLDYDTVLAEARGLRSAGAYRTRAGREIGLREQGLREADEALRGSYDDAVEQALGPEARDAYRQMRRHYAHLLIAGRNTGRGTAAAHGNRLMGFSEQVGGGAGHAHGGPGEGAMMALLANTLRRYEPTGRATWRDLVYQLARGSQSRMPTWVRPLLDRAARGAEVHAPRSLVTQDPGASPQEDTWAGFDLQPTE